MFTKVKDDYKYLSEARLQKYIFGIGFPAMLYNTEGKV